ncbi:MAG: glycoside hydrolase family 15 protein, partial [Bdellovibrionaceae bacterium]|nr:glycoside hydrolase family 15 protein [Pseudobdellovibrionaceae bacterium]
MNSQPLHAHRYNMGLIGNCAFSALVSTEAEVSWMCLPRFDSSFIFGSLLDSEKGGTFAIRPVASPGPAVRSSQTYLNNTNILCTRFESKEGIYEVIDFAPRFQLFERYHKPLMLFRKVKKISGNPRICVTCQPVGDYGRKTSSAQLGSNHIRYQGLEQEVRLTTNASLTYVQNQKEFALAEDLYFVLSWGIPLEGPLESTFEDFLSRTKNYWTTWVERCA